MEVKKYLISSLYAPESYPVDWSVIPDSFLGLISRNLYNVSAVNKDGNIVERTVVFLHPVEEFPENVNFVELDNGEVVIGIKE